MEEIAKLCMTVCDKANLPLEKLEGIGVGLPGTVHPTRQTMLNGNSQIFIGKDFAGDLNRLLKMEMPILLENDASCFALAEALSGAGTQYELDHNLSPFEQTGIGIILGTGVGGGIILGGKILTGANGGGGEIGHSELINDGIKCYCGRNGCVEQYLSGPGVEAAYLNKTGTKIKSYQVFEDAKAGKSPAKEVIDKYIDLLAKFLVNLTNVFDPHYFVLGGGVSKRDELYQTVEQMVKENSFLPQVGPRVYQHKLGDSAGVLGAAFLLLKNN